MFRFFAVRVAIRVLLLLITTLIFAFIFGDERLFFNHIIVGIIIIIQVAELIHFVNHTNRELARLFNAIKHSDFSSSFHHTQHGKSFRALSGSLNEIIKSYREVKIEKEAQFHFLRMLISHLQVGIISFRDDGEIMLMNPMAGELLNVTDLTLWKDVHQRHPELGNAVAQLPEGGRQLIELKASGESHFLSVDVSRIFLIDRNHTLITFQNINSEIEQKEIEAWHRLIRILTHEIMNSVTPISSLTETLKGMIENDQGEPKRIEELQQGVISDLQFSLRTIQKRSDGLLTFVEHYRKFTRVPKPVPESIPVVDLFEAVKDLMRPELGNHLIDLSYSIESEAAMLYADRGLVEQVLINLIGNSIHALKGRPEPHITLLARVDQTHLVIEVADNGKGIPVKEREEIFIPFFTTRKDGSGIGLSLSKQILSMHRGSIRVQSEEGVGTTFFLRFRRSKGEDPHSSQPLPVDTSAGHGHT